MRLAQTIALLLVTSLATKTHAGETTSTSFRAMGTRISVQLIGGAKPSGKHALAEVRNLFEHRHRAWYPWRPDARLARINRRFARGRTAAASAALIRLLRRARSLEQRSGGRFNPAIGGLIRAWGFDHPPPYDTPPPSPTQRLFWLAMRPSLTDLRLGDDRIRSTNPAVRLDLGGIAKGATVAAALDQLRSAGADASLVNAGGDVAGFGTGRDEPWRIGIRDPAGGVLASLELGARREAVFSSGDYERYRTSEDGERRGHVLDPRTGEPARGAIQATVVSDDATKADAAATALLVAGAHDWRRTAEAMGLTAAMIIDRSGTIRMSRDFAERVSLRNDTQREVIVRPLAGQSSDTDPD